MKYENMDGDIAKLIALLKKILKNHPSGADFLNKMDKKEVNINLCFLTIMPMLSEDLEELQELYDEFGVGMLRELEEEMSSSGKQPKLEFKLNRDDLDFLKKNGLVF